MKISKDGDLYRISMQSAYSKYQAVGTVRDNKMFSFVLVSSDPAPWFATFTRLDDNRMEQVTRDPDSGKETWRGILIR
jgi:hypothetical protein